MIPHQGSQRTVVLSIVALVFSGCSGPLSGPSENEFLAAERDLPGHFGKDGQLRQVEASLSWTGAPFEIHYTANLTADGLDVAFATRNGTGRFTCAPGHQVLLRIYGENQSTFTDNRTPQDWDDCVIPPWFPGANAPEPAQTTLMESAKELLAEAGMNIDFGPFIAQPGLGMWVGLENETVPVIRRAGEGREAKWSGVAVGSALHHEITEAIDDQGRLTKRDLDFGRGRFTFEFRYGPRQMGSMEWDCRDHEPKATIPIRLTNDSFEPRPSSVRPCDTLDFQNQSPLVHSFGFREANETMERLNEAVLIQPGENWPLTFNVPGTFYVYCKYHSRDWTTNEVQGMFFRVSVDTSGPLPPAGTDGP